MRGFILRFLEILAANTVLSCIATAVFKSVFFVATVQNCTKVLVAVSVIFIVFNVWRLRYCFFDMRSRAAFYIANYAAYALFIVINMTALAVLPKGPYTWLFAIEKLWSTACAFNISNYASAIATHTVMLIVIALSPIGMSWIFEMEEPEDEEEIQAELLMDYEQAMAATQINGSDKKE